jgi:hypothetical protein
MTTMNPAGQAKTPLLYFNPAPVEEEFKRLCKRGRRHLVLGEVLKFQPKGPPPFWVDLCHLGVLWVLDRHVAPSRCPLHSRLLPTI